MVPFTSASVLSQQTDVSDSSRPVTQEMECSAMTTATTTTPVPASYSQGLLIPDSITPTEMVRAYLDSGLMLVPEVSGTTRPKNSGWQTATINEQNFAENFPSAEAWNVGFRTGAEGNGFHDVDLDCPEAVHLAPHFLPETGWVFGRASNPCSHYVYKVTEGSTPTKKMVGVDGDVLVELRGDRSKTTAPPSYKVEPNEHVRWDQFDYENGPTEVGLEELKKVVSLLALACLILRHYPVPGARHGFTLSLAGGLIRSGLSEAEISHLVLTVAAAAGDPNLADRLKELQTTFENYRQNKPTTGWPTLATLLGDHGIRWVGCLKKCIDFGNPRPPEPTLPLNALPEPVREIVEGISASLGADPALCLLPLLTALGAAIGTTRAVRPTDDWTAYPFLWTAPITDAGGSKTPSKKPISEILSRREKDRLDEYYNAFEAFEEDEESYKKARKAEESDRPEKPIKPLPPCTFASDITLESLALKLQGNPKGILLWVEELNDLFSIPSRYSSSGGDVSRFNALYDGVPIRVSRKTGEIRERDLFLDKPFIAISGGIQPSVLARVVRPEFLESGFLQRFILVRVESRLTLFQNRSIPQATKAKMQRLFDILFDLQHADDGSPIIYRLSDEALLLFEAWVNFLERLRHEEKDHHLKSALSKQKELVLRILVIFQTVQCVRFSLSPSKTIDICMMAKAIALTQWLTAEWAKVYQTLRSSNQDYGIERLQNLIWSKSGGTGQARVRDLMRWNNRNYPTVEQATQALQGLVELGLARTLANDEGVTERCLKIQLLENVEQFVDSSDRSHLVYTFQPPDELDLEPDCEPCRQGELQDLFACLRAPEIESLLDGANAQPSSQQIGGLQTIQPATPVDFTLVSDDEAFAMAMASIAEANSLAIDIETTGLNPDTDRIRLISVTTNSEEGGGSTFVFDLFSDIDVEDLWTCFHGKTLFLHNASFDLGFLRRLGFVHDETIHDTMLMARLLHAGTKASCSLKDCLKQYLGIDISKDQQGTDWSGELTADQLAYAATDTAYLHGLAKRLLDELEYAKLQEAYTLETGCLLQIVEMSRIGVPVDIEAWLRLNEANLEESQSIEEVLNQFTMNGDSSWNWNSPNQVKMAFQAQGIVLTKTDDDTLAKYDHPLAAALRRYRKVKKLLSAYGSDWLNRLVEGRIHPNWKQLEARTGRMACSEPNIQQLPKDRYRAAIAPGEGRVLIKADYSQIELRVLAEVTQDPKLLDAYKQGQDLHEQTAREVLQIQEVTRADRQLAKALNFGLAFGMGSKTFAQYAKSGYGVELTDAEAKEHRAKFLRTYAGVKLWQDRVTSATGKLTPETRTLSGRRRLVPSGDGHTERLNTPIQGTAADGLKAALGLLWQRREEMPEARVIIACHDEIVVEAPIEQGEAAKVWLVNAMVDGMARYVRSVPVVVEATVGPSWQQ
jgi:DNA polymerase-1